LEGSRGLVEGMEKASRRLVEGMEMVWKRHGEGMRMVEKYWVGMEKGMNSYKILFF
jgi:hypothetical protein